MSTGFHRNEMQCNLKNNWVILFFSGYRKKQVWNCHIKSLDLSLKQVKMKKDYWNVEDEQIVEKTGKKLAEWIKILDKFKAADKKSNEVVAYLQEEHKVPRYWARTLTTHYVKLKE
jgi:hypothetical protein